MKKTLTTHIGTLDDIGSRFVSAWKAAEKGRASGRHVTFIGLASFARVMTRRRLELLLALKEAGPSSVRALGLRLGRDYKSVHSDVATLIEAGLVTRSDDRMVQVPWDRITAELDLKAA